MADAERIEETKRIRELIRILNEAGKAYYADGNEIMTNFGYDKLYDELTELEQKTGIVFANSPTQNVGYEVVSELPKVRHEKPMLSLAKTKDVAELAAFAGEHRALLSWKMDGLTVVLTYEDGRLSRAVTRGNGEIGELITGNAKTFVNVPLTIPYRGQLILRGEAVILYSDFEKINAAIGDADARYKNPRNLCSGSVRQQDSRITAQRSVRFYAFSLVKAEDVDFANSRERQFEWLKDQGFEVVHYEAVTGETVPETVRKYAEMVETNDVPSDGLVLLYDDIAYGESLGRTAKAPRNAIAFKWKDETEETKIRYIEWSPSRTGLINPVAVFDPVQLEGTTVSRASVHNISIMEELELGEGDTVTVFKANMIIPQIAENKTRSGVKNIPEKCPVCGGKTEIRQDGTASTLWCTNSECPAKKIKSFSLFVSRDALNIGGLSEATLEKLIAAGCIHEYRDMFRLKNHRDEIIQMEGFGEKSYENLEAAVNTARHTQLYRVVYGLGVAGIGLANAKMLCRHFGDDFHAMRTASKERLMEVDGIGEVLADAWTVYFADEEHNRKIDELLSELTIESETAPGDDVNPEALAGETVVITGSLEHFSNRKLLQEEIEKRGGKVTGSVTGKTTILVNNDTASTSSKNKKAKELGIPILSEEEFMERMGMQV
ncbi:MAG: NAD-dependent DNA ligase LigA [[Clostridium] aminophilum]|uniref:NAD-dependent DNA ligase LigA n=1 Tax=[Clostridium] aminophilum TaxID=1526 RepID=UPI0026EDF512|nr:NAD-dependent DNA ligase LigA [[Clostridium] aminophilum]MDD6195438.1 NAD-dependent DNA ligase LigA [[Clostridium] aminophilum]